MTNDMKPSEKWEVLQWPTTSFRALGPYRDTEAEAQQDASASEKLEAAKERIAELESALAAERDVALKAQAVAEDMNARKSGRIFGLESALKESRDSESRIQKALEVVSAERNRFMRRNLALKNERDRASNLFDQVSAERNALMMRVNKLERELQNVNSAKPDLGYSPADTITAPSEELASAKPVTTWSKGHPEETCWYATRFAALSGPYYSAARWDGRRWSSRLNLDMVEYLPIRLDKL
jgi:hypothetical protein